MSLFYLYFFLFVAIEWSCICTVDIEMAYKICIKYYFTVVLTYSTMQFCMYRADDYTMTHKVRLMQ